MMTYGGAAWFDRWTKDTIEINALNFQNDSQIELTSRNALLASIAPPDE